MDERINPFHKTVLAAIEAKAKLPIPIATLAAHAKLPKRTVFLCAMEMQSLGKARVTEDWQVSLIKNEQPRRPRFPERTAKQE